jgi:hypothetical protein
MSTWCDCDPGKCKGGDYYECRQNSPLIPTVNGGLLTALKEIAYGEEHGVPNGGIMCRAIARAAIEDFTG